MIKYFPIVIILFTSFCFGQDSDSIYYYRGLSKKEGVTNLEKISYAKKAIQLSKKTNNDSTILNSNKILSYLYIVDQQFEELKVINYDNLLLAKKIKDTVSIANANYNLGYAYKNTQKVDSAYQYYFRAVKLYDKLKDYKNLSAVLLNMANIQEAEKDYIGAQNNIIKAINLVDKLPIDDYNLDTLWSLYNLIGIVSGELQQYDSSLEYHKKAIKTADKIRNSDNVKYYNKIYSNVNIASTYRKRKDYDVAIEKYEKILEEAKLLKEDTSTYTYVVNDLAYSMFLRGKDSNIKIENLFRKAYRLSDSISDENTNKLVCLNFSEYFFSINALDSALYYSKIAYNAGKELKDNKAVLESLLLTSKIEDGERAKKHLFEYIKLNDSLFLVERSNRNKFMKIDFETEEIKQENRQMSEERLWLITISISLLFTLLFLYIIKYRREKNKELQLQRQQQEANEEIYNLMLSQQDKIDEARGIEKNRISKDIHDGILGKLFGVRLSLDSLNLSTTPEATAKRSNYINELKNIEDEIRKVSHELNTDFIQQSGYLDIVKALVDTQMTAYNIKYTFSADENIDWDILNNKIKINVYRILQETMQNAYKHAKAPAVNISFKFNKNLLTLTVLDNGVGFDLQRAKNGIGIKNIDSRITEIGGKLVIDSKINKGTKIIINVPILDN